MSAQLERILAALGDSAAQPLYLVWGDRVLAEPEALRLAEALAEKAGCSAEVHRRPAGVGPLLADLKTFSLFEPAKVLVAVDSAVLADLAAAASLVDEAIEALPVDPSAEEPTARERRAALRLFQALRLLQIDPEAGTAEGATREIPDWALAGAASHRKSGRRRARPKTRIRQLRGELAGLLELGRAAGLRGWAESEVEELARLLSEGLPEGHTLVLAESSVAAKHPLVGALEERGALLRAGSVESERGGWKGLEPVAAELERQTGTGISRAGLDELARRTLRKEGAWGREVDADSTARFAAEYRKLAGLAAGAEIAPDLVAEVVADRGEQDVWGILDAIGSGRPDEALGRLRRLLAAAEDPMATRLSLFGLLAGFCRQLAAIGGRLGGAELPAGERSYGRFKSRIAPKLQEDVGGGKSPLAGVHPFRLHRAYLAAGRMSQDRLAALPARVLETELALKGESGAPEVALAALVADLATDPGARPRRAG